MADSRLIYQGEDSLGTKLEIRKIPNGCIRFSIQSITMRGKGWESVELPEEEIEQIKTALGGGVVIVSCPADCKYRKHDWLAEPCVYCEDFNKYEPEEKSDADPNNNS